MSGTPNYLKAGDINRSMRSHETGNYLLESAGNSISGEQLIVLTSSRTGYQALNK